MMDVRRLRRTAVFVTLLLLAHGGASGQGLGVPAATEPAPVPAATPSAPPGLRSARATMRTFLDAFAQWREGTAGDPLADAVSCLDLDGLPESIRSAKGPELAVQLKDVIDRTRYVRFEEIPDDGDGDPYVFLRRAGVGEVVIARADDDGWRFTRRTIETLPALIASVEDAEVVAGVVEAPRDLTPALWLRSRMPRRLRETAIILEHWQWLGLLLLAFVGLGVDRLVTLLSRLALHAYLRRRKLEIDVTLLHRSLRPLGFCAMALLWWFGLLLLGLPVDVFAVLLISVKFVVAVALVFTAYRAVDVLTAVFQVHAARTETKFDDLLVPFVGKSLKIFIFAFGLVFVADNLGTDVKTLLAGLGIGGLAVALAAKDMLSNLFGSLTVLVERPFHVGDWIKTGDVEGTVEEVGFRSTRIRTFYNSLITLPNSNLINSAVDNLGARRYRRWKTLLAVTYGTPPERIEAFCEGIRELILRHPYTRKDYYHVYFNEFGSASLDVLLYVFFETPDWATELRERHRFGLDVVRLAHRLGVEFAFPTQTIHLLRGEPAVVPGEPRPGYGSDRATELEGARRAARDLLESSLGGAVPPPVAFEGAERGEAETGDDEAGNGA